jgi:hypothetical protein
MRVWPRNVCLWGMPVLFSQLHECRCNIACGLRGVVHWVRYISCCIWSRKRGQGRTSQGRLLFRHYEGLALCRGVSAIYKDANSPDMCCSSSSHLFSLTTFNIINRSFISIMSSQGYGLNLQGLIVIMSLDVPEGNQAMGCFPSVWYLEIQQYSQADSNRALQNLFVLWYLSAKHFWSIPTLH